LIWISLHLHRPIFQRTQVNVYDSICVGNVARVEKGDPPISVFTHLP
jgi:hypothetical protein